MYRLTEIRMAKARETLDRYNAELQSTGTFAVNTLERDLQRLFDTGYQEIKSVMIDLLRHGEYELLAAYFMEHSNPTGVVSEFQVPLAALYGATSWRHDATLDSKRRRYWERAFA